MNFSSNKQTDTVSATPIDHHTLSGLVRAHAVRAARVIGQPGGWGVIVKHGSAERPLAATRSKETRVFKRFETLVNYLKKIGISRFDVDAADFDAASIKTYGRPDTSATLKRAHAALVYDTWFREQIAQSIRQADDPATRWVSNSTVMAESAKRRAAWRALAAAQNSGKGGV